MGYKTLQLLKFLFLGWVSSVPVIEATNYSHGGLKEHRQQRSHQSEYLPHQLLR